MTFVVNRPGLADTDPRPWVSPGRVLPSRVFGAADTARGWYVTIIITLIGAVTRFVNLQSPTDGTTPVFDEKHYVPQAYQQLMSGRFIEDNPGYPLVVHPPVGKWVIAAGEWLFGYTPLGWRFAAAICGTIMIFVMVRVVRRMTRNTWVGAIAGIFLICDSVTFVASRTGLLDIFLITFGFCGFACLIADRDQQRLRFARVMDEGRIGQSPFGPRLGFRWWRFTGAMCVGMSMSVKWSGVYFLFAYFFLLLVFDVTNRVQFGVARPWLGTIVRDLVPNFLSMAMMPVAVYMTTWAPWFASETSVDRYVVGTKLGDSGPWSWIPAPIRGFGYYESAVLNFHDHLTNSAGYHHPWESKPWTWPMGLRPVLYYYTSTKGGCGAHGAADCVNTQLLVGTPALWWFAIPMLLWSLWKLAVKRDWRYLTVLVCYGCTWLPWFIELDRQMYFFYAIAMAPFMVIGFALIISDVLGLDQEGQLADHSITRRRFLGVSGGCERLQLRHLLVAIYLGAVIMNFAWLWPILTGVRISAMHWNMEMWLPSWR